MKSGRLAVPHLSDNHSPSHSIKFAVHRDCCSYSYKVRIRLTILIPAEIRDTTNLPCVVFQLLICFKAGRLS